MKLNKRDAEFLFEIGTLRNVERGWRQHLGMRSATILEHSFRVMFIALILARKEGVKNEEKIIKMAMIHDIAETRTTDFSIVQKLYVKADEKRAIYDLLSGTTLSDLDDKILKEYEVRKTAEAKIVKDADNLDIDLEMKEFEERGSQLPKKWRKFRILVRNKKLYTKSAKELWDIIQKVDVSDWMMKANKWVKQPNAGK